MKKRQYEICTLYDSHSRMYQHTISTTTQNVSVAQSHLPARKGTTSRRRSYFTRLGDLPDCESANEVENCGNDGKDACPVEDNGEELQNKSR
jgi:hypothetical protein